MHAVQGCADGGEAGRAGGSGMAGDGGQSQRAGGEQGCQQLAAFGDKRQPSSKARRTTKSCPNRVAVAASSIVSGVKAPAICAVARINQTQAAISASSSAGQRGRRTAAMTGRRLFSKTRTPRCRTAASPRRNKSRAQWRSGSMHDLETETAAHAVGVPAHAMPSHFIVAGLQSQRQQGDSCAATDLDTGTVLPAASVNSALLKAGSRFSAKVSLISFGGLTLALAAGSDAVSLACARAGT